MPGRKVVLATGEYYHILNRGNASQPTFLGVKNYQRFLKIINYYQYQNLPLRFSKYLLLAKKNRGEILKQLDKSKKVLVEIYCFCLMTNHYHLLLKQKSKNGISKFIGQLQNSYTRYFNVKKERIGSVFQGQFKAVRVETEEQLVHLSRYIHLNPYSSYLVKTIERLKNYPWSSLPDYLGENNFLFLKKKMLLNLFKNSKEHQKFIFDQADYQRRLQEIKHLTFEK